MELNVPINSKLQHPPPPPSRPRATLGIWTFEDWLVQNPAPWAKIAFKCPTKVPDLMVKASYFKYSCGHHGKVNLHFDCKLAFEQFLIEGFPVWSTDEYL